MTDIKQMLASNLNDLGEIHLSAKDSAVLLTIVYDLICVEHLYERIKELEQLLIESRTRIDDLERWVAGIADDKQMPTYVQQSARSLLAQEGELSMTVPKGYAIVPIEPTDSMIDAGLGADSNAFPLKYMYQAMIEAAQEGE